MKIYDLKEGLCDSRLLSYPELNLISSIINLAVVDALEPEYKKLPVIKKTISVISDDDEQFSIVYAKACKINTEKYKLKLLFKNGKILSDLDGIKKITQIKGSKNVIQIGDKKIIIRITKEKSICKNFDREDAIKWLTGKTPGLKFYLSLMDINYEYFVKKIKNKIELKESKGKIVRYRPERNKRRDD